MSLLHVNQTTQLHVQLNIHWCVVCVCCWNVGCWNDCQTTLLIDDTYTYMCVYTYIHIYTHTYTYIDTYTYAHVIYVNIYIYIYTHTYMFKRRLCWSDRETSTPILLHGIASGSRPVTTANLYLPIIIITIIILIIHELVTTYYLPFIS